MGWEEIAANKRNQRLKCIELFSNKLNEFQGHGSQRFSEIKSSPDAETLVSLYRDGELAVKEVVAAYIERAILAHEKTNCLTEVLFLDAIANAERLDEYYKTTGKLIGPLHGVPMSVKDQFDVVGVDTTLGYVGRASKPAFEDASLVKVLKRLGAVILTKTNVPQSILWGETENPIWGLTTLPQKPTFTPGGSSGGEAALLSLNGSCCGWGTDIGGSIRGPCHFNGLFGLKPTHSRISHHGVPGPHEGQEHVPSSVGPMSGSLSTLVTVTKAVFDAQPWLDDARLVPISWREDRYMEAQNRPLKIGLIVDDGVVEPHPPVARAIKEAAALFQAAGHEIVPWDTSDHMACIKIQDQFYRADGGEDIKAAVATTGEPLLPHVETLVAESKPISVYDYWQLNKSKVMAQQAYNQKWNMSGVDVLLSPVAAHTALPHRSYRWTGYTKIWNFLDYAAMAFPFTNVSARTDSPWATGLAEGNATLPRSDLDAHNRQLYDPLSMDGLSVGIQIVGRRFDEEFILGVAEVLQKEITKQAAPNGNI